MTVPAAATNLLIEPPEKLVDQMAQKDVPPKCGKATDGRCKKRRFSSLRQGETMVGAASHPQQPAQLMEKDQTGRRKRSRVSALSEKIDLINSAPKTTSSVPVDPTYIPFPPLPKRRVKMFHKLLRQHRKKLAALNSYYLLLTANINCRILSANVWLLLTGTMSWMDQKLQTLFSRIYSPLADLLAVLYVIISPLSYFVLLFPCILKLPIILLSAYGPHAETAMAQNGFVPRY